MSLRGFGGTIRDAIPHFDGIKLRRRKSRQNLLQVQQAAAAQEPAAAAAMATTTRHRSFGSIFSFADSIKASVPRVVSRTDSVRVTRKERKTVRAQDIFFGDPTARYVVTHWLLCMALQDMTRGRANLTFVDTG